MIFGPPPHLALPSPHYAWFKEAMESFWWNWSLPDGPTGVAPYGLRGPYWPFNPFVGLDSSIRSINARTTVEAGSVNSVSLIPDQHGVSAFITLVPVDDKRLFCERAVALALRIGVFVHIEDTRAGRGLAAIESLCEMFGQPPTLAAWQTGPPERQVRIAVIELLKELGADPDLIKYRNRSALKLQVSPPSLRVGRVWVPSGRARPIGDFGPGEAGYPPEDHPLFPVKQPHAHDGLYYDTIPADAASIGASFFFPEVVPSEWPEFLHEFSSLYAEDPTRGSWPKVSTLTDRPPIPPHGALTFTGLEDATTPGGGQTRRLVYEGEFEGEGDWAFGTIPWADNKGYRADIDTLGATPWGEVDTHIVLMYDEAFPLLPPTPRVVDGYVLDWFRVEINVYDAQGAVTYSGGGINGQDAGYGTVLGLTNIHVKGTALTDIGMFDADRLPMSRVTVKVFSQLIKVFDEDDQHFTDGGGGDWKLDHYVFPDSLLGGPPPPWPAGVRTPGTIAVGPGLRGSHPTVKGLRGGRVIGSRDLRSV